MAVQDDLEVLQRINKAKKADKLMSSAFLRVIAACLLACGLTLISIFTCFDKETSLLKITPFSTFVGIFTAIIAVYIIVEVFILTATIFDMSGHIDVTTNPLMGIASVFVSVCFLFQGVFDLLSVIEKGKALALNGNSGKSGKSQIFIFLSGGNALGILVCIFSFLSALAFALEGMNMIIKTDKAIPFFLKLMPPIWAGLSLLHIMMTYPSIASMQGDFSKVIASIVALLFLYYISRWLCGLDKTPKAGMSVFIRLVFAPLMGIFALPYCIAAVFSVRDTYQNTPYLVFFGLMLFAIIFMLQYMAQALYKIEKSRNSNRKKEINIE